MRSTAESGRSSSSGRLPSEKEKNEATKLACAEVASQRDAGGKRFGNGNADKDAIRDYIHVTHPAYALLCDGDQDRYDACCVGLYGLDVLAGSEGLKLT